MNWLKEFNSKGLKNFKTTAILKKYKSSQMRTILKPFHNAVVCNKTFKYIFLI